MIAEAESRPVIYAGGGIVSSGTEAATGGAGRKTRLPGHHHHHGPRCGACRPPAVAACTRHARQLCGQCCGQRSRSRDRARGALRRSSDGQCRRIHQTTVRSSTSISTATKSTRTKSVTLGIGADLARRVASNWWRRSNAGECSAWRAHLAAMQLKRQQPLGPSREQGDRLGGPEAIALAVGNDRAAMRW